MLLLLQKDDPLFVVDCVKAMAWGDRANNSKSLQSATSEVDDSLWMQSPPEAIDVQLTFSLFSFYFLESLFCACTACNVHYTRSLVAKELHIQREFEYLSLAHAASACER